jgi:hypothetical protein
LVLGAECRALVLRALWIMSGSALRAIPDRPCAFDQHYELAWAFPLPGRIRSLKSMMTF